MELLANLLSPGALVLACAFAFAAGLVKGVVGFAMPMIMISAFGAFMSAELALAALILPTFVTNSMQALRQGPRAALSSMQRHRRFLLVGLVTLVFSAQLVRVLPDRLLFLCIGGLVVLFALMRLRGWVLHLRPEALPRAEVTIGGIAGFIGGLSGIWGPPTVAYLSALNTPKEESLRVQGVVYGLGAFALTGAHLKSGVLSLTTLPLSAAMILPAVLGLLVGARVSARMDQAAFGRATLVVLLVAGLNLVRRGVMG